jgi:quinol monooxygenase YgiN
MGRVVIVAYRPKPGQQDALRALVREHVPRLRAVGLVTDRVPIAMEGKDGTVLEVFEWASAEAIQAAHTHPVVARLWEEFGKACDYLPLAQVAEASQMFADFTPLD